MISGSSRLSFVIVVWSALTLSSGAFAQSTKPESNANAMFVEAVTLYRDSQTLPPDRAAENFAEVRDLFDTILSEYPQSRPAEAIRAGGSPGGVDIAKLPDPAGSASSGGRAQNDRRRAGASSAKRMPDGALEGAIEAELAKITETATPAEIFQSVVSAVEYLYFAKDIDDARILVEQTLALPQWAGILSSETVSAVEAQAATASLEAKASFASLVGSLLLDAVLEHHVDGYIERTVDDGLDQYVVSGLHEAVDGLSAAAPSLAVGAASQTAAPLYGMVKVAEVLVALEAHNLANADMVARSIEYAKLQILALQAAPSYAFSDVLAYKEEQDTIAHDMMTGSGFNVDLGRRLSIVNAVMLLRARQVMDRATESEEKLVNDLVTRFDGKPGTLWDKWAKIANFGRDGLRDYAGFAREVASELNVAGSAAADRQASGGGASAPPSSPPTEPARKTAGDPDAAANGSADTPTDPRSPAPDTVKTHFERYREDFAGLCSKAPAQAPELSCPYIAKQSCEGEGCVTRGALRAEEEIELVVFPGAERVAATVAAGEYVFAEYGEIWLAPCKSRVQDGRSMPGADTGDIFWRLNYRGEGTSRYWSPSGKENFSDSMLNSVSELDSESARNPCNGQTHAKWVLVTTENGVQGWTDRAETFLGSDIYSGDDMSNAPAWVGTLEASDPIRIGAVYAAALPQDDPRYAEPAGETASGKWGPDIVVPTSIDLGYRPCGARTDVRACLSEKGLRKAAIDFSFVAGGDLAGQTFAYNFHELGKVDLAHAEVMLAFSYPKWPVLLNGPLDLRAIGGTPDLAARFTDAASRQMLALYPRSDGRTVQIESHRTLADGTQRFALVEAVIDGCEACPIIGSAVSFLEIGPSTDGELRRQPIGLFLEDPDASAEMSAEGIQSNPAGLQLSLNMLGYDAGPMDGIIGPRTRSALTTFQRDHCLPASGRLNSASAQLLIEADGFTPPDCATTLPIDGAPARLASASVDATGEPDASPENTLESETALGDLVGEGQAAQTVVSNGCAMTSRLPGDYFDWTGDCADGKIAGRGKLTLYRDNYLVERLNVGKGTEFRIEDGEVRWIGKMDIDPELYGVIDTTLGKFSQITTRVPETYNVSYQPTIDRILKTSFDHLMQGPGFTGEYAKSSGIVTYINATGEDSMRGETLYAVANKEGAYQTHDPNNTNIYQNPFLDAFRKEKDNYNENIEQQKRARSQQAQKDKIARMRAQAENIWSSRWDAALSNASEPWSNVADLMRHDKGRTIAILAEGRDILVQYEDVRFVAGQAYLIDQQLFTDIYEGIPEGSFSWESFFEKTQSAGDAVGYNVQCTVSSQVLGEIAQGETYRFRATLQAIGSGGWTPTISLDCAFKQ